MVMFQERRPGSPWPDKGGSEIADTGTAESAAAWLRGEGDLVTAGMGRPVPASMQLGVLTHGDLERLRNLGRYCRRGSVRRTWGAEMARLAGDIADAAGTRERLEEFQTEVLVPLELKVLEREVAWTRRDLADRLRECLQTLDSCHHQSD
jgi:hypothetical protein